ncbi:hypothetical protein CsSME_00007472 [Camellia sinensis var. sinensis]
MGSLICPNGPEPVIHQDNRPVVLPVFRLVDHYSFTPISGLTATHLFVASLLLLSFCLLSTVYTSYKALFHNGFAIDILLFLMDINNSDDNQNTRMWSSRIEMKLINILREEVQKNQTKDRSTMWTVRH